MHCNGERTMPRHRRLHRSRRDKILAGVCGGLAEHFEISSFWVRTGFVIGMCFSSGALILLYFLCMFIMPLPNGEGHWKKTKVSTPPQPRCHSRKATIDHLENQFDLIEEKIKKIEDHVTSKEYVLKRQFDEL